MHLATACDGETLRAMRLPLAIIALGLSLSPPAWAGNLYRCVGADGIPNYSSRKVSGADCKVVAKTSAAPASRPPAAKPAVATPVANASPTVASAPAAPKKQPRFVGMGASTTYAFVDENGVRNYSSKRPSGVANVTVTRTEFPIFAMDTCYACGLTAGVNFGSVRLNTQAYQSEIQLAARQHGVDEALVRAIIHAESAFRANARSNKGAQGLMQLIPATASRFGVSDPYDPAQNISGGVQYLAWLLKRYRQDTTLAAAAYNAGEGAVDRNGGVPPYAETRLYVQRVAQLLERYRTALAGG